MKKLLLGVFFVVFAAHSQSLRDLQQQSYEDLLREWTSTMLALSALESRNSDPFLNSNEPEAFERWQEEKWQLSQKIHDMENEMYRRASIPKQYFKEFWNLKTKLKQKTGATLFSTYSAISETDKSPTMSWEVIYKNPKMVQNIYRFLNSNQFPDNAFYGILFTKTPPKDVSKKMGLKDIECLSQIFGQDCSPNEKRFNPKQSILYMDPEISYEEMESLFTQLLGKKASTEPEKAKEAMKKLNPANDCPPDRSSEENDDAPRHSLKDVLWSNRTIFKEQQPPDTEFFRNRVIDELSQKLAFEVNDTEKRLLGLLIQEIQQDQIKVFGWSSRQDMKRDWEDSHLAWWFGGVKLEFPDIILPNPYEEYFLK